MSLVEAESILSAHGFKQTRQRRAVLEVMTDSKRRLTPAEIHELARERCPELGIPTVYRTLGLLEQLGLVRRIHTADNCEGFAPVSLFNSHHVLCVRCGEVAEFDGCNVPEIIPEVERQTGFHIEQHFLELFGTCDKCQHSPSSTRST